MEQLNEVVKILRDYLREFNVYHLGFFDWWDTYALVRSDKLTGKIIEDRNATPKISTLMRQWAPEAAHRLAYLGFPRQRAVLTVTDGEKMTNHITGGEPYFGGFANRSYHGMNLDINGHGLETLIHEHAHMYWFNLSAPAKAIFKSWYANMVGSNKEQFAQSHYGKLDDESQIRFKKDFLAKRLPSVAYSVIEKFVKEVDGTDADHYFHLKEAYESKDPQKLLRRSLLTSHSANCAGILLKPLWVGDYSHSSIKELPPGEEVVIRYYGNKYIISWFVPDNTYKQLEHQKSFTDDQMTELVKIDKDKLTPEQKTKVKKNTQLAKKPPVSFFAPPQGAQIFKEKYEAAMATYLNDHYGPKYKVQIWWESVYNSFKAKLRMRKDKITSYKDVIDIFKEVVDKHFLPGLVGFADEKSRNAYANTRSQQDIEGVGKPVGSSFRNYLQKSNNLPSSYAAANVDELWAVTVERAAMDLKSINPELRRILLKVLQMK